MKKVTALLLAIVATAALAIGMVGCSGPAPSPEPTPSDAVTGLLDAVKAQDAEAFAKYYAGEAPESLDFKAMMESEESFKELSDEQKAMIETIVNKVLDFDYAVDNEQVDGDKATVDVTFTTYDFAGTVETLMGTIMSEAMSMQATGDTDQAAAEQAALESIQKVLDGLTSKDVSSTVTVDVAKDAEGNWKVSEITDEERAMKIGDAVLGGLVTKLQGLMEQLGGSFDLDSLGSMVGDAAADKAA